MVERNLELEHALTFHGNNVDTRTARDIINITRCGWCGAWTGDDNIYCSRCGMEN